MFLGLSVWLSVCLLDYSKGYERILMKFFGGVGRGPSTKWLDFGGDPVHDRNSEILSRIYTADCIKSFIFTRWKHLDEVYTAPAVLVVNTCTCTCDVMDFSRLSLYCPHPVVFQ